jgi:methyl-accepting chemotaxis protein
MASLGELTVAITAQTDSLDKASKAIQRLAQDVRRNSKLIAENTTKIDTTFQKAADNIAKSTNKVSKSAQKNKKDIKEMSERMTDLAKSVQVALGPLSGVAARITAITSLANRNTASVAGMVAAIIAFGAAVFKSVKLGKDFEVSMGQISAQLKTVAAQTGVTISQVEKLSEKLGKETLSSAQEARKAISVILAFPDVAKANLEKVLFLAQDLTAVMGGDLRLNARRLARALEDPANSLDTLRRAGVFFTDREREMFEVLQDTNDKLEAQDIILNKLSNTVGGAAKGATLGLAGALDTLSETTKLWLEQFSSAGGTLDTLAGIVNTVNKRLEGTEKSFSSARNLGRLFNAALKALTPTITYLIRNIDLLIASLTAFVTLRALLTVIISLLAGVAGKIGALIGLFTKFSGIVTLGIAALSIWFGGLAKKLAESKVEITDVTAETKKLIDALNSYPDKKTLFDADTGVQQLELKLKKAGEAAQEASNSLQKIEKRKPLLGFFDTRQSKIDKFFDRFKVLNAETLRASLRSKEFRGEVNELLRAMLRFKESEAQVAKLTAELAEARKQLEKLKKEALDTTGLGLDQAAKTATNTITDLVKSFFQAGKITRDYQLQQLRVSGTLQDLNRDFFLNTATAHIYGTTTKRLAEIMEDLSAAANPVSREINRQITDLKNAESAIGVYGDELRNATLANSLFEKVGRKTIVGLDSTIKRYMKAPQTMELYIRNLYEEAKAAEIARFQQEHLNKVLKARAAIERKIGDVKATREIGDLPSNEFNVQRAGLQAYRDAIKNGFSTAEASVQGMNAQLLEQEKLLLRAQRLVVTTREKWEDQNKVLETTLKHSGDLERIRSREVELLKFQTSLGRKLVGATEVNELVEAKKKQLEIEEKINSLIMMRDNVRTLKEENKILNVQRKFIYANATIREREVELERKRIELQKTGAKTSTIDAYIDALRRQKQAQEELNRTTEGYQQIQDTIAEQMRSVADVLLDLSNGTDEFKEAIKGLVEALRDQIIQLGIINPIMNRLFQPEGEVGDRPEFGVEKSSGVIGAFFDLFTKQDKQKVDKEEALLNKELAVMEANLKQELAALKGVQTAIETTATNQLTVETTRVVEKLDEVKQEIINSSPASTKNVNKNIDFTKKKGSPIWKDLNTTHLDALDADDAALGRGILPGDDPFKDKMKDPWDEYEGAFGEVLMGGVDDTESIWTKFTGGIGDILEKTVGAVTGIGFGFVKGFSIALNHIIASLSGGGGGGSGIFGTILGAVFKGFVGGIGGLGSFGSALGDAGIGFNTWSVDGGHGFSFGDPMLEPHGFANGGSFVVGGTGGTDSQLVGFRASPGEMVSVRTKAQQLNSTGGTGGNTYNIDARGVDPGQMDRLLRLIRDIDRSVEVRSVRATADSRMRNPGLFGNRG